MRRPGVWSAGWLASVICLWLLGSGFMAGAAAGNIGVEMGDGSSIEEPGPAGSLSEVLLSTLRTHEGLKSMKEEIRRAELRKRRFLLGVSPTITLKAGYSRWGEIDGSSGGAPSDGGGGPAPFEGEEYGYNITLIQPLYTGGRATSAYRAAGGVLDSLRLQEELIRQDLLVASAEAYYGVLAAADRVRIGEQAVRSAERHLSRAAKRLELGEAVLNDRLRAEVNLAQARSTLAGFRNELNNASALVERLCGAGLVSAPPVPPRLAAPEASRDEQVAKALSQRREIEQGRLSIAIAEADTREKKGRFYPELVLSGGFASAGEQIDDRDETWAAALTLSIPIFQRASRFYELKESRTAVRQARHQLVTTERDIALQVRSLSNSLQASNSRADSLRKGVDSAGENLRLSEKRYDVGMADIIEVMDAQTALVQAQVQLAGELYLSETLKLQLHRALGRDILSLYGIGLPREGLGE